MNKRQQMMWTVFGLLASAWLVAAADAADWGSLKGRFVVDGTAPEPSPLVIDKDEYCIQSHPKNNSIVVGPEDTLANVVVYVSLGRRDTIDVYPDLESTLSEQVELDNKGCSFFPHVALVRTGQPLLIKNTDPVGHNTKIEGRANKFNQTIPAGDAIAYTPQRAETIPAPVSCSIHPFMHGVLVVQDHPYMAVSGEDGTFEIKNLPAGKHDFQFWHEVPGYLKDVKYNGGSLDRRGRAELTIPAGDTLDLGDVHVPASILQ